MHVKTLSSIDSPTFQVSAGIEEIFCHSGHCKLFRSDRGTNFIDGQNQVKSELNL